MKEAEDAERRWKQEPEKKIRAIDIFARIPYVFKNPTAALLIAAAFFVILYMSIEASIFSIAGEIGRIENKPSPVRRRRVESELFADVVFTPPKVEMDSEVFADDDEKDWIGG